MRSPTNDYLHFIDTIHFSKSIHPIINKLAVDLHIHMLFIPHSSPIGHPCLLRCRTNLFKRYWFLFYTYSLCWSFWPSRQEIFHTLHSSLLQYHSWPPNKSTVLILKMILHHFCGNPQRPYIIHWWNYLPFKLTHNQILIPSEVPIVLFGIFLIPLRRNIIISLS